MSKKRILMLGASSFIGSAVIDLIYTKHPEYRYTALVRSNEEAGLNSRYPSIQTKIWDGRDAEFLKSEAEDADIVISTSKFILHADNEDAFHTIKLILEGLATRSTPRFFIHTSSRRRYGTPAGDYGAADNVNATDNVNSAGNVNAADNVQKVYTAIVSSVLVYGSDLSVQQKIDPISRLTDAILKRGKAFQVNVGVRSWDAVHVRDLARIYLALVESAASGGSGAQWDQYGFYFAETECFKWSDISQEIADIAHEKKYLASSNVDHLSPEEIDEIDPMGCGFWGTSSRCKASRARELFGWKSEYPSLLSCLEGYVDKSARVNGLQKIIVGL